MAGAASASGVALGRELGGKLRLPATGSLEPGAVYLGWILQDGVTGQKNLQAAFDR
jgi:hypothetical protein